MVCVGERFFFRCSWTSIGSQLGFRAVELWLSVSDSVSKAFMEVLWNAFQSYKKAMQDPVDRLVAAIA